MYIEPTLFFFIFDFLCLLIIAIQQATGGVGNWRIDPDDLAAILVEIRNMVTAMVKEKVDEKTQAVQNKLTGSVQENLMRLL